MKTVQFTGTQNQLVNLKNAMEFTDNDMPQQSETRVYVVDVHKIVNKFHITLGDEEFQDVAESQGTVYTLKGFQESYNIGRFDEPHYVIRFINIPFSGETN